MRPVPTALAARLATGSSKAAWMYRLTTKTGAIYRFTEGDVTVPGGYAPYPGFLGGAVQYGLDGNASSIDIQLGVTDDTPITRANIRDGFFDAAEVDIYEYDQDSPGDGQVQVFWGRVGDVQRRLEGGVKLTAKGILAQSYEILIQHYVPICIWFFCDTRCGLNPALFTYSATITAIAADGYSLTVSGAAAGRPDNVFLDGVASVTSGERTGLNLAVRGNSGPTLLLHLAAPAALHVGDTLSVLQGCRKIWDATDGGTSCTFYGNRLRFGGQPRAGSPEEAQNITYSDWTS